MGRVGKLESTFKMDFVIFFGVLGVRPCLPVINEGDLGL